jgi:hypothetical protein
MGKYMAKETYNHQSWDMIWIIFKLQCF